MNDDPANNAPQISGTPPRVIKVGVNYSFTPAASDADADTLVFTIGNKPAWIDFDATDGSVSGMPLLGSEGTYSDIAISVSDGQTSASLPGFSITVEPTSAPNMPPEISGTPASRASAGNAYSFRPAASDPDGDPLMFSIQNLPGWAAFDTQTGRLSGTPQTADADTYLDIAITVTDGQSTASLPAFSITVDATNAAPSISGTPPASVATGAAYSFTPDASDPDGDPLSFDIQGLPAWASFDSSSGRISGTPQAADVGTYAGIVISVNDGDMTASLPAFAVTVNQIALGSATLTWTPPTQNSDGTPLTDLAGYRIYYGTTQGVYPNTTTVDNPGVASVVVDGLTPGTWYFVSTTVNSQGIESEYSNVASKTVN